MAWIEEPSTPAAHVYRSQEWERVYDADALCAGGRTLLKVVVVYPWWKNLRGQATVRVLLRGNTHIGTAEVLPEEGGVAVVKVHLKR